MRRSSWIIALMVVLAAFAGWQQFSSWSLTKSRTAINSPEKPGIASERQLRGGAQGPSGRQGRGGGGREAVPVLLASAEQKAVPVQIRAVGNVEPFATWSAGFWFRSF